MERRIHLRRRIIAAALTIPALLALTAGSVSARTGDTVPKRICSYDWREGTWQVKQLIKCAARRWDSPGGPRKALSVAKCESGYDPDAYNSSGYAGVFQHAVRYWPDRSDHYGFPDRSVYNGRANIIVAIRMSRSTGWDPWGCG
jgi:hypothetical protein